MNTALLFDNQLEFATDVHIVPLSKLKKVPGFLARILEKKERTNNLYYQFGPNLQIIAGDGYSIMKHNNSFFTFTQTGARFYKGDSDVSISEFQSNIDLACLSGTKEDEMSLECLYNDFKDEQDPGAIYIYDNLITILEN